MTRERSENSLSGTTAVIVGVDAIQALHLYKVLASVGVTVLANVATQRESLPVVRDCSPDLILLDVDIRQSDDASFSLPSLAAHCACLFLLSPLPDEESRLLATQWRADGYLLKPASREQILARLKAACAGMGRLGDRGNPS